MRYLLRKKTVLILTFLLTFSASYAQRFSAGILAGAVTSQVSGDMLAGFDKSGFEFGALVTPPLSPKFSMAFEMVFIQKGSKKKINYDKGDYDYFKMSLNYIEVPLLLRYNYSKKIHFEMGPVVGRLLSSKEEDEFGEILAPKPFKPYELSFMLGMSYALAQNFYLNLQGSNSVLEIRTPPEISGYQINRRQYNSVLMFSFKYVFSKKEEQAK